jgi:putative membrane protein
MKYPSRSISAEDRRKVNEAVAAAESQTSAEVVAAIAGSSGRYDRAEDVVGLWTAILLLAAVWVVWPLEAPEHGSWDDPLHGRQLAAFAAAVVVGFVVGAVIGSKCWTLRRLFTPKLQMQEEVYARAKQTFFDQRVHRTAGSSGLLIYVSLFEHRAAIISDQSVLEKLGQPAIDELCRQLIDGLGRQSPIDAICTTARTAGERLAAVLPRAADDVNELDDALIVID